MILPRVRACMRRCRFAHLDVGEVGPPVRRLLDHAKDSSRSATMWGTSKVTERVRCSPSSVVRSDHSFANQQQAAFIPTPNCERPLASAGGSATRNARSQSLERDARSVVPDGDRAAVRATDLDLDLQAVVGSTSRKASRFDRWLWIALSTSSPSAYQGWYFMCGNRPEHPHAWADADLALSVTPLPSTRCAEAPTLRRGDARARVRHNRRVSPSSSEPGRVSPGGALSAKMSTLARHDTKPEMLLRRELHRRGLRFRVQMKVPATDDERSTSRSRVCGWRSTSMAASGTVAPSTSTCPGRTSSGGSGRSRATLPATATPIVCCARPGGRCCVSGSTSLSRPQLTRWCKRGSDSKTGAHTTTDGSVVAWQESGSSCQSDTTSRVHPTEVDCGWQVVRDPDGGRLAPAEHLRLRRPAQPAEGQPDHPGRRGRSARAGPGTSGDLRPVGPGARSLS